jgi:hypothetical protein
MRLAVFAWAALCLGLPGIAQASATFPQEVDKILMLQTPVEDIAAPLGPGGGCLLCHQSPSGGFGTNNAFGTMMKNAGCVGTVTGSVDFALAKLEQTAPRAIADLQMAMDPNNDPLAINNDPVPQYGCGSVAGWTTRAADRGAAVPTALAVIALCLIRRHKRRLLRGTLPAGGVTG